VVGDADGPLIHRRVSLLCKSRSSAPPLRRKATTDKTQVTDMTSISQNYQSYRSVYDFSTAQALREALLQREEADDATTGTSATPPQEEEAAAAGAREEGRRVDGLESSCQATYDWYLDDVDPETQREQRVDHEVERLMDLKSYMILDGVTNDVRARSGKFDHLACMASRVFGNRFFATTTLVDMGRQYFLSYTFKPTERFVPRKIGFCSHAILHKEDIMIVTDTTTDHRFQCNPFVTGDFHVRFYAAVPLVSKRGYHLGTFSLTGKEPRPQGLTESEQETLKDFARLAVDALEDHRTLSCQRLQLRQASQALACAANDLLTPLTGIQLSAALLSEDAEFTKKLQESEKKSIRTTTDCVNSMVGICGRLRTWEDFLLSESKKPALNTLMDDPERSSSSLSSSPLSSLSATASTVFNIGNMVERLDSVMNAIPKRVPLYVVLDPSVPSCVMGDEVTIFRATLNLLRVCLQRTSSGFVRFTVRAEKQTTLVFECEDTGPLLPTKTNNNNNNSGRASGVSARTKKLEHTDAEWFLPMLASSGESSEEKHEFLSFHNLIDHVESIASSLTVTLAECKNSKDSSHNKSWTNSLSFQLPLITPKSSDSQHRDAIGQKHDTTSITSHKTPQPSDRRRSVLVVDDSNVICKCLDRALSKLGVDVTTACNGMEGLQLMKHHMYDFVLLDFLM